MKRAGSLRGFVENPVGTWILAGTSVVWCASPSLCGAIVWGSPDVATTRAILDAFEGLWATSVDPRVDVILDASRVDRIDSDALALVLAWNVDRRSDIVARVRQQIGVVAHDVVGITLAGILPIVGETHPFRVVHDPLEGHRALRADGEALHRELEAIVAELSGVSPELAALRDMLRDRYATVQLEDCARALSTSTRSLQRVLGTHGTSFQQELRDARFAAARTLLATTDEKIAAIAHRVGVSEGALTRMIRQRTGQSPADLRRSLRDS